MGFMYEFPHTSNFDSDLREIIELYFTVKNLPKTWEEYKKLMDSNFKELKLFVENYFANLDLQDEIDNKIEELIADGRFEAILREIVLDAFYYNAMDYGAVGDGVADDSLALIKCVAKAKEDGKDVYIPSGTYLVTVPIELTGVRVFGIASKTIIHFKDTTGFVCKDNSELHNLVVKGSGGLFEIVIINGNHTKVINCELIPIQIGISIYTCSDVVIDRCNIHPEEVGGGNFGLWSNTEVPPRDVKITNCRMANFQINAIFAHFDGGIIDSCYFENNHLQVQPTGGGHLAIIGALDDNNVRTVISNNIITGGNSVTTALEIDSNRVLITGNYVYNIQAVGVTIQNRVGVHVVGNYFQNVATCIATANNMTDYNITGNYAELVNTFIAFGEANERFAITDNVFNQVNKVHNLDRLPLGNVSGNTPDISNLGYGKVIQVGETIPLLTLNGANNFIVNFYFGHALTKLGISVSGVITTIFDSAQIFSGSDESNKLYIYNDGGTIKIKNNVAGSVTVYMQLEQMC